MTRREKIAKMTDEEYDVYFRAREAKKQGKWRRKMKTLRIPVVSNMSVKQRQEFYASRDKKARQCHAA